MSVTVDKHKLQATSHIIYPIGSKPAWTLSFLLGIQQYLTMFGATILIPFIVGGAIGLPPVELALLISTTFFVSGMCTLIQQSPIGNRLPIIQGGSFSFLGPTFAIVSIVAAKKIGSNIPIWQIQIQEIAGAIMIGSIFEIIIGYTGIIGIIKKFISPIVIGPTIAMIGLALYGIGAPWMAENWIISLITLISLIIYSQVLSHKFKLFLLFPVLFAIVTGWFCSFIATFFNLVSPENAAFLNTELLKNSSWLSFKHMAPFKWGMPSFTSTTLWAGVFGMLAGYCASIIESIGDYYACARISKAPVPTKKMISKGIGAEGIGCFIAGIFQTCSGTTSYSENIGAIGLTKVASRRVIICGAVAMLFIPLIGKFGALLATIPKPVIGAMFVGLFGMIASVGLSSLQEVNLNNSRNLFIVGISFFCGLSVPAYFGPHPVDFSTFGYFASIIGNIFQSILNTGMAVTACIAMLLDNTLPGATKEERGISNLPQGAATEAWKQAEEEWAKIHG